LAVASVHRDALRTGLDDLRTHPRAGIALVHGAALLVASVLIALEPEASSGRWLPGATLIAVGLSSLRVASVRRHLSWSTLVLDGVGTALLLASTGAPGSPFTFLVLAGTWWASLLPGRSARAYVVPFAIAYAVLVGPSAMEDGALMLAVEELIIVLLVGVLAHRLAPSHGDALEGTPMGSATRSSAPEPNAAGPERASHHDPAANRFDWTTDETELLGHLAIRATAREIASAMHVSESTARRRITRLYQALGVTDRRAAVVRARALGLSLPGVAGAASRRRRRPTR
jgi:DNA-binding CsgD family transcriptional regulator